MAENVLVKDVADTEAVEPPDEVVVVVAVELLLLQAAARRPPTIIIETKARLLFSFTVNPPLSVVRSCLHRTLQHNELSVKIILSAIFPGVPRSSGAAPGPPGRQAGG
ncbi:MAG TPA: hypothetical protein VII46_01535 [Acidimicrobiales bacterium]